MTEVLAGLFGQGEPLTVLTVQRLRLPRALVGLLVGLALGAAGALTQGVACNPLASPDFLGVTAGASAGAVAVLLAQGSTTARSGGASAELAQVGLPLGALAGAALAAVLVLALTGRRRTDGSGLEPHRLILVGLVLTAAFTGLVDYALVRRLDVLLLGDPAAIALGIRAGRSRLASVAVAVALAGAATAAAGPVTSVALVAPNLARRLVRGPGIPLVGAAGGRRPGGRPGRAAPDPRDRAAGRRRHRPSVLELAELVEPPAQPLLPAV